MKVKAIKTGFIFGTLMEKGDEFTLISEVQFSSNWMEKVKQQEKKKAKTKAKVKKTEA
jgi:hypothetical protein